MAYVSQEDKKKLAPAIKAVLKKYGVKGTIAIHNHSTLVVNIKSGSLDFINDYNKASEKNNSIYGNIGRNIGRKVENYFEVNPYHYEKYTVSDTIKNFFDELIIAMKGENWKNNTDISTDYFDISYYISINIGQWDKPYVFQK